MTEKKTGVRKIPKSVTPTMPLNTAIPSDRRISEPAPEATTSGNHADDESERGHQDRPQPQPACLERRLAARQALQVLLLGVLDDQDGVLARQPHQHHQADLHEDIDVPARIQHARTPSRAGTSARPG